MAHGFESHALSFDRNLFSELAASARFEQVAKGRKGTVLVRSDPVRGTPIVRTTTRYDVPAQCFRDLHVELAEEIRRVASLPGSFNNGLIERYTNAYATMGLHSDQALDLVDDSFIAVFTCYRDPPSGLPPRLLVVRSKEPGTEAFDVPLAHHHVVVFSLDTNRRFKHKIVLDASIRQAPNEWLGITFRTSRTFVQHRHGKAFFEDDSPLTVADEDQRRDFYRLRGCENRDPAHVYPPLPYTISDSDVWPPTPA